MPFQKPYALLFFVLFIMSRASYSQIGAEAQGGNATLWMALGIDQTLTEKWMSVTDAGYGRHSDPNNYAFVKRQGLNVLTQDFVYRPNQKWHFFFSIGYWRRNFYSDDFPYDQRNAPFEYRNEVRPYQRISYHQKLNRIKISHTLRTDYRFYYTQDFKNNWSTPFEFRLRYLESWKIPFSKNNKNWLIIVDEALSAIDEYSSVNSTFDTKSWTPYQFTENRLSVYYRRSFSDQKIEIDLGVMHQYWRDKPGISTFNVSYNFMFDVILKDPFTRKKTEVKENE